MLINLCANTGLRFSRLQRPNQLTETIAKIFGVLSVIIREGDPTTESTDNGLDRVVRLRR